MLIATKQILNRGSTLLLNIGNTQIENVETQKLLEIYIHVDNTFLGLDIMDTSSLVKIIRAQTAGTTLARCYCTAIKCQDLATWGTQDA